MKKDITYWFIGLTILFTGFTLGMLVGRNIRLDPVTIHPAAYTSSSTETVREEPPTAGEWRININTASVEILDYLPGVGPVLAQRIIDYREQNGPFEDIRELTAVPGIGESILDKISEYIILEE